MSLTLYTAKDCLTTVWLHHEAYLTTNRCYRSVILTRNIFVPGGDAVKTSMRVTPEQPTSKMACSTTVWLISTPTQAPAGRAPVYCGAVLILKAQIYGGEQILYRLTDRASTRQCVDLYKKLKWRHWPIYTVDQRWKDARNDPTYIGVVCQGNS